MPTPYPKEFRRDVVAVTLRGQAPPKVIAADFGIAESCLRSWLHAAAVEDDNRPGVTASNSAEVREALRRIRLPEQEHSQRSDRHLFGDALMSSTVSHVANQLSAITHAAFCSGPACGPSPVMDWTSPDICSESSASRRPTCAA